MPKINEQDTLPRRTQPDAATLEQPMILKGDFAQGERTLPVTPVIPDFARGERTLPIPATVGDFATGEHELPVSPVVGDFATGEHDLPAPPTPAPPPAPDSQE